jgi:hypothetical protein
MFISRLKKIVYKPETYDARSTADFEGLPVSEIIISEGSMKGCLLNGQYVYRYKLFVTYRQNKTDNTQTEQTSTHLSDSTVIDLLSEAQTTKKHAHT